MTLTCLTLSSKFKVTLRFSLCSTVCYELVHTYLQNMKTLGFKVKKVLSRIIKACAKTSTLYWQPCLKSQKFTSLGILIFYSRQSHSKTSLRHVQQFMRYILAKILALYWHPCFLSLGGHIFEIIEFHKFGNLNSIVDKVVAKISLRYFQRFPRYNMAKSLNSIDSHIFMCWRQYLQS